MSCSSFCCCICSCLSATTAKRLSMSSLRCSMMWVERSWVSRRSCAFFCSSSWRSMRDCSRHIAKASRRSSTWRRRSAALSWARRSASWFLCLAASRCCRTCSARSHRPSISSILRASSSSFRSCALIDFCSTSICRSSCIMSRRSRAARILSSLFSRASIAFCFFISRWRARLSLSSWSRRSSSRRRSAALRSASSAARAVCSFMWSILSCTSWALRCASRRCCSRACCRSFSISSRFRWASVTRCSASSCICACFSSLMRFARMTCSCRSFCCCRHVAEDMSTTTSCIREMTAFATSCRDIAWQTSR
eukprot:PhM_4_TR15576/c0_g1_i1/m.3208